VVVATLVIPQRAFAARVRLEAPLFFSHSLATDVFTATIRADIGGAAAAMVAVESNIASTGVSHYLHPSAVIDIPANTTCNTYILLERATGSGSANVFGDSRHSRLDAILVPA
jgi:hypothetical protein